MGLPSGTAIHCALSPAVRRLARKRRSTGDGDALPLSLSYKVHVASENNFPTAAGLASSAAGFACLGGCSQGLGDPGLSSVVVGVGSLACQHPGLLSLELPVRQALSLPFPRMQLTARPSLPLCEGPPAPQRLKQQKPPEGRKYLEAGVGGSWLP